MLPTLLQKSICLLKVCHADTESHAKRQHLSPRALSSIPHSSKLKWSDNTLAEHTVECTMLSSQACKAALQAVGLLAVICSSVHSQNVCIVHVMIESSLALGKQLLDVWRQLHCHRPWSVPVHASVLLSGDGTKFIRSTVTHVQNMVYCFM